MSELPSSHFPSSIYIATYDVAGYEQATGREKETRKTGIVTHTNELIDGFAQLNPSMQITVSQMASPEEGPYGLVTPEGQTVFLTSVQARHPKPYETDIYHPDNPTLTAYAEHYAADIFRANTSCVLVQNPLPLIGMLKAEELGCIDPRTSRQLQVTTIMQDSRDFPRRFDYIGDRLKKTSMDVAFVAISQSVRNYLLENGIPEELITVVPHCMNIERFDERISRARKLGTFACIQARNSLPEDKKLILCPAARVKVKGPHMIIEAARILKAQGKLTDAYIAFAGKGMVNTASIDKHTEELEASIRKKGLVGDIVFLDALSSDELAACYGSAYASLLPSTHPEGFAYTNLESMLAGAPVITSRSGGPLDYIVHNENGLLVEPGDPVDLANAIDDMLSSPTLHASIAKNGRKTAQEYSLGRMIEGYAKVLSRAR